MHLVPNPWHLCGYEDTLGCTVIRNVVSRLTRKAELKVACDLVGRGYSIAIPYGEDSDFDLVVCREGVLERVQVKHATSNEGVVVVKCTSHSLTNGKVRYVKHYTSELIDWIAIWDSTTDRCFYVHASELGAGRSILHLRLTPARNGQVAGTRNADDYCQLDVRPPKAR
jgi:hypothetical protein